MTDPRWARLVDALVDSAVLVVAAFTVVYEVALLGPDLAATTVLALGAVLAAPGVVLAVRRALRREEPGPDEPDGATPDEAAPDEATSDPATPDQATPGRFPRIAWGLLAVAVVTCLVLAALLPHRHLLFWPTWTLLVLVVAVPLLLRLPREGPARPAPREPGRPSVEHAVAAFLCVAAAAWSALLVRPDADDVYYLNRSVWVAAHDTIPLKDTIFGPEVLRSVYGGSNQINSVETLYGALARLLGVEAPTMTWLVAAPLLSAAALWALWRLTRTWAPRAALGVHLVAALVLFLSADTRMGDLGVPRMGQGKSVALLLVVPLVWVWTTRWLERRDRWSLVMLPVAGIAFTGLTTSAVILVPAIAAAVVLGSLLVRRLRAGLAAAALLVAFPVTMGVIVALSADPVGDAAYDLASPRTEFLATFSDSPLALVVTALGFAVGWFFTRSSTSRALAGAAALGCLLALVPPLRTLAHALTGTGPVLWRWQLLVPLPVLVGLAALGVGHLLARHAGSRRLRPVLLALPAALVLVAMVVGGRTVISHEHSGWSSRPAWDVPPDTLRAARAALALPAPPGDLLAPDDVSMTAAQISVDRFTVSPRPTYTEAMDSQPGFDTASRKGLQHFARTGRATADVPDSRIPALLDELDIATACFRKVQPGTDDIMQDAGFRPVPVAADTTLVRCYVRAD